MDMIFKMLKRTGWNIKESVSLPSVPEKTLDNRCPQLGIKLRGSQSKR
jgi:hypothetical protein